MDALRHLGDHPLTIRLLDLGADKFPQGFSERNPFLGCRSMRLLRGNPEIFRQQIRAVLRASALGKVRFMFPMIATSEELRECKDFVADVREELDRAGVPYDKGISVGMMIEVPAAAMMADRFAREVDFFSIGTNDLIQYTLAVDRNNEHVSHLFSATNPAVLRLIRLTVDAADKAGIDVAMCGEMASDILYTPLLIGVGLQRLSMALAAIPDVKKLVRTISYADARKIAETVADMHTSPEIEDYLRKELRRSMPEFFAEGSAFDAE